MTTRLRVALFSDSHYEANGVARTTTALESYAAGRGFPLLSVHAGPTTRVHQDGSIVRVELARSRLGSFGLEHDLRFDLMMWRHVRLVRAALASFAPDVLHFTGPSDIGQLGAYLGHRLGIPMVGSWHTNLHEYASRRLQLRSLPRVWADALRSRAERRTLDLEMLFYKIPRVVLAPNDELAALIGEKTGKPTFEMSRGVDTTVFAPQRRRRRDAAVNIGYVGRLSPEKSVRILAALSDVLAAHGRTPPRFTIVGEGSDRTWLQQHLPTATFTGVLRGHALAEAYADMDLFVFPSQTETVGNVVLEALASGVPVVAMAQGGPRFVAGDTAACVLASDHEELVRHACALVADGDRRAMMRAAARAHAERQSWDRIFDDVYGVYQVAVTLAARERAAGHPVAVGENQPAS